MSKREIVKLASYKALQGLSADICEFLDLHPGDFVELVIKKKNKPRP